MRKSEEQNSFILYNTEDVAAKYKAWGWYVQEIPGNDPDAIREAIIRAKAEKERPSLIIGHTIMGQRSIYEDVHPHTGQAHSQRTFPSLR